MGRPLLAGVAIVLTLGIVIYLFWDVGADPSPPTTPSSSSASSVPAGMVQYVPYDADAVGDGKSALLFFASDDPFSEASDTFLKTVYGSGSAKLSTYRLDFRSSTGARLTYGVLVANTFVLLDGGGQRVTAVIHPSDEELRILLRGNIPVAPSL